MAFTFEQRKEIVEIVNDTIEPQIKLIKEEYSKILVECKATTTSVQKIDKKVDELIHALLPSEHNPQSGIFNEVISLNNKIAQTKQEVDDLKLNKAKEEGQIVVIKWVIGGVTTIAAVLFVYILNHISFVNH